MKGASSLARKFGISELAIGLTIVAFGTSAPEMVVNVLAAADGHSEVVLGNIIGSNNFNLLMILGLVAIISPIVVQHSTVWKEVPFSLLAALLLLLLANNFWLDDSLVLSRMDGLVFLTFFALFLIYVWKSLKAEPIEGGHEEMMPGWKMTLLMVVGLAGLVIGGKLVVDQAIELARAWGVSEAVISLTIVAAGTSLPELATSVVAATKKNSDIAIGNVVGSNIFNIFLVLGISTLVQPVEYDAIFDRDLYLLLGGTLFLFAAMFTGGKKRLDRWEGVVMLLGFVGYTGYLIVQP